MHFGKVEIKEVKRVGRLKKGITWVTSASRIECDRCAQYYPTRHRAKPDEPFVRRLHGVQQEDIGDVLCCVPQYYCTTCVPVAEGHEADAGEECSEEEVAAHLIRRFGSSDEEDAADEDHAAADAWEKPLDEAELQSAAAAVVDWALREPSSEQLRSLESLRTFEDYLWEADEGTRAEAYCLDVARDVCNTAADAKTATTLLADLQAWLQGDGRWCYPFLVAIAAEYRELFPKAEPGQAEQ